MRPLSGICGSLRRKALGQCCSYAQSLSDGDSIRGLLCEGADQCRRDRAGKLFVELISTGEQAIPERAECHVEHVVGFAVQLAPCLQVNEPLDSKQPR